MAGQLILTHGSLCKQNVADDVTEESQENEDEEEDEKEESVEKENEGELRLEEHT